MARPVNTSYTESIAASHVVAARFHNNSLTFISHHRTSRIEQTISGSLSCICSMNSFTTECVFAVRTQRALSDIACHKKQLMQIHGMCLLQEQPQHVRHSLNQHFPPQASERIEWLSCQILDYCPCRTKATSSKCKLYDMCPITLSVTFFLFWSISSN